METNISVYIHKNGESVNQIIEIWYKDFLPGSLGESAQQGEPVSVYRVGRGGSGGPVSTLDPNTLREVESVFGSKILSR